MSQVMALAQRELRRFFRTPVAWTVVALYLLAHGLMFVSLMEQHSFASFAALAKGVPDPGVNLADRVTQPLMMADTFLLLLFLPGLTMRLMAEEWRSGTSDLLLSYPLTDSDIIAGKYLSAVALLVLMLGLGLVHPIVAGLYAPMEFPTLIVQQLGLLLFGLACLAVGLLFSTLTENQILAFGMTVATLFVLWFLGWWGTQLEPPYRAVVGYLSTATHIQPFGFGVLSLRAVVYFLVLIAFCLYLAVGALESKRWGSSS